jgi:SAM-dependent methyltransferase
VWKTINVSEKKSALPEGPMKRETFDDQFKRFRQMSQADGRFDPKEAEQFAVLDEDTPSHTAKDYDWTYLTHCSWAARVLAKSKPKRHTDIGSYSYFAGVASAFVPMEFYDIRPIAFPFSDLRCGMADLTALQFQDNSIESLSCMHVIDHIGLARYGDALDAKGDVRACRELMRVLAPGGELLIVQPMNETPRLNFNAHRVLSFKMVHNLFDGLNCAEFTALADGQVFVQPKDLPKGEYTGCFVFTKL